MKPTPSQRLLLIQKNPKRCRPTALQRPLERAPPATRSPGPSARWLRRSGKGNAIPITVTVEDNDGFDAAVDVHLEDQGESATVFSLSEQTNAQTPKEFLPSSRRTNPAARSPSM